MENELTPGEVLLLNVIQLCTHYNSPQTKQSEFDVSFARRLDEYSESTCERLKTRRPCQKVLEFFDRFGDISTCEALAHAMDNRHLGPVSYRLRGGRPTLPNPALISEQDIPKARGQLEAWIKDLGRSIESAYAHSLQCLTATGPAPQHPLPAPPLPPRPTRPECLALAQSTPARPEPVHRALGRPPSAPTPQTYPSLEVPPLAVPPLPQASQTNEILPVHERGRWFGEQARVSKPGMMQGVKASTWPSQGSFTQTSLLRRSVSHKQLGDSFHETPALTGEDDMASLGRQRSSEGHIHPQRWLRKVWWKVLS